MKLRVSYAKRSYKDRTYVTPLVVTSYRDANGVPRHKTITSLAKLPAFVVDLIDRALRLGDTALLEQYVLIEQLEHLGSIVLGPVFVVVSLLKQLGIFALLQARLTPKQAAAVTAIIVERVIALKPLSVMALQRRFAREPTAHLLELEKAPALKTWYAALARLELQREAILEALFERNHTPGRLYLYDITSSYFEGDSCELAAFGYNRDGKKGKKQIVIGIICDERGCPLWVDVFQGDTADQTTVKQQFVNLRDKLGVSEFTFVGDRGMVTHARIRELGEQGWWRSFSYITALTRQEMLALVEDEQHPLQLELFDPEKLAEVESEGTRYVLCHNPQRAQRDAETRQRLLAATAAKLDSIRKNVAAGRLKKPDVIARRLYRWIHRWGMQRFFEVDYGAGEFSYSRREQEIARYTALDGCYVIRSNVESGQHSGVQLRDRYKDLKHVEQAFRTMKTSDIQTRPIRHFHEPQVRGHVFACFLAYRVIWELRQRLEPVLRRDPHSQRCEAGSLAEIWRELSSVTLARLSANGKTWLKLSKISPQAHKLLRLCQVPSLEQFRTAGE